MTRILAITLMALMALGSFSSVAAEEHTDNHDHDQVVLEFNDGLLQTDQDAGEVVLEFNDGLLQADEDDGQVNLEFNDGLLDLTGQPSSYINPDIGMETANDSVNPDSSCEMPDQMDIQKVSDPGTTVNNVHNDACLLSASGMKVDGPASFESSGVGVISACPDPDGEGPKTSMLSDDGLRCYQSGYQETGNPGDQEFHVRLNSDVEGGPQTVIFCSDANNNGCADEEVTSTITIGWVSSVPDEVADATGGAVSYVNPDTGMATANADVAANSSCATPDQSDTQELSAAGTALKNVHIDACLLDDPGNTIDGPASFESFGVGSISGCPDPDGEGPKVAELSADGRRCYQSGYQQTGNAGDLEFHVRLNNDSQTGEQTIIFCADANNNGCADEQNISTITITWVANQ